VTRHSHRGLIALGLAVCLSLFGDLTLYAVLVTQLETTGLALGAVGIMLGINRLIRIPGNLLGGLLLDRYGRRRLFILLIQFAGEGITLSTVTLLLQQRFGHSVILLGLTLGVASAGGLLLGVRSLLAGAVGPLIGHVSDVAAKRWPLIVAGLGLAVLGFGLLAWAISLWQIVLGIVLGAAGAGTILALLSALIGDLVPPERHGLVMGGYATAGDIGSTAGPFLAFALLSLVELRWVYLLCAMLLLLGLGLAWRAQEAL